MPLLCHCCACVVSWSYWVVLWLCRDFAGFVPGFVKRVMSGLFHGCAGDVPGVKGCVRVVPWLCCGCAGVVSGLYFGIAEFFKVFSCSFYQVYGWSDYH